MASTNQEVLALRGQELRGSDGEKLGTIEEIYLDSESNEPEWALVTTGMFGTKQSFVPLSGMSQEGDTATVPFDKATVKDAPKIDPDGQLSEREEAELYRHYGRDFGSAGTAGTDVIATATRTSTATATPSAATSAGRPPTTR